MGYNTFYVLLPEGKDKTSIIIVIYTQNIIPDRIGLLGKPPAAEHLFPSKSQ
jgi:hypothetical protein